MSAGVVSEGAEVTGGRSGLARSAAGRGVWGLVTGAALAAKFRQHAHLVAS
jgi:hypothetical protein